MQKQEFVISSYREYLLRPVIGGSMPVARAQFRLRSSAEAPGWLTVKEDRQMFGRAEVAIDVRVRVVELTMCHVRTGSEAGLQLTRAVDRQRG